MAITQGPTTSFLLQSLQGQHNFGLGGHTFKLALFTSSADLGPGTASYTPTNEVVGSGYTAGGVILTNAGTSSSGQTAWVDFQDAVWNPASFTARAGLIYNTTTNGGTDTTDAVLVLDFGLDRAATNTFTVQFPTAGELTAILAMKAM